jgi:hypothetical protein
MKDFFKGKRIIRYDPNAFRCGQILEALANGENQVIFDNLPTQTPLNLGIPKITTIGLSYPVLLTDKRWDTIQLTASSLFLGSSLANAGFAVKVKKQILPVTTVDWELLSCDLVGLTLFEDLFIPCREFLSRLKNQYRYRGIIAAGGPLITLTPLAAAFHLPEINLLVRGEAELVLPGLIAALNANDMTKLLDFDGFLFQIPGLIIISNYNEINRPVDFQGFRFNLDFLEKEHVEAGLEMNFSRGCKRGCLFCSAVQGKALRKLPESHVEELLIKFSEKLNHFHIQSQGARTININDDDILQDPRYAGTIFQLLKKHDFRLWGIQTSINSFFSPKGEILAGVLDTIADPPLYVENQPLVWAGTDAFLKARGKRLGKNIPGEAPIIKLVEEFEKQGIKNYHYWISSDHLSDWQEFIQEFTYIYRLQSRFKSFGLLPHAPFLVPYSPTPLYEHLLRSPEFKQRLKYKKILGAKQPLFNLPLVERVETGYIHLNRLLNNEKSENRLGFFDYLKQKDFVNAFITLYTFLKQERLEAESMRNRELAAKLKDSEAGLEESISHMIRT